MAVLRDGRSSARNVTVVGSMSLRIKSDSVGLVEVIGLFLDLIAVGAAGRARFHVKLKKWSMLSQE